MVEKTHRSKIIWHCRRGMLELDLLLTQIIEKRLDIMSAEQIALFEHLLTHTDPEIYAWLMGHEEPPEGEVRKIVKFIQSEH